MSGLRIIGLISIPIVVVLVALLVILAFTGTGDRALKDNLGNPIFSTPTVMPATGAEPALHQFR